MSIIQFSYNITCKTLLISPKNTDIEIRSLPFRTNVLKRNKKKLNKFRSKALSKLSSNIIC